MLPGTRQDDWLYVDVIKHEIAQHRGNCKNV